MSTTIKPDESSTSQMTHPFEPVRLSPNNTENLKNTLIILVGLSLILSAGAFNSPQEIIAGLRFILRSPSVLISDYIFIGNIGAAFINSGTLVLLSLLIARKYKAAMDGKLIASIMIVGGFAFFGKNLFNVWPVIMGVAFYAWVKNEPFGKHLPVAFFGTALAPVVSFLSFGYGWPLHISIPLGYLAGIGTGFVLPPLSVHFMSFHKGFNLYNVGFTAGIVGMFIKALLRGFNLDAPPVILISGGNNFALSIFLYSLCTALLLLGFLHSENRLKGLMNLWAQSGHLSSDFTTSHGAGLSLINMALLGYITTSYVLLVGGELNGPVIGGIFTVVGFGSTGKHLRNVLPILVGVYISTVFKIWDPHSTGALLAALFGTALAPITGVYGWKTGVLAGFLHMSLVMNISYLHGGLNLYNNGFSCGFVAAAMVPVLDSLKVAARKPEPLPRIDEVLQPATDSIA